MGGGGARARGRRRSRPVARHPFPAVATRSIARARDSSSGIGGGSSASCPRHGAACPARTSCPYILAPIAATSSSVYHRRAFVCRARCAGATTRPGHLFFCHAAASPPALLHLCTLSFLSFSHHISSSHAIVMLFAALFSLAAPRTPPSRSPAQTHTPLAAGRRHRRGHGAPSWRRRRGRRRRRKSRRGVLRRRMGSSYQ